MWWWCLDNAPSGVVDEQDYVSLATAAGYQHDPPTYIIALIESGFADQREHSLCVHNWMNYAGKLVEQRQANAEKQKRWRERQRNGNVTVTPPEITPTVTE